MNKQTIYVGLIITKGSITRTVTSVSGDNVTFTAISKKPDGTRKLGSFECTKARWNTWAGVVEEKLRPVPVPIQDQKKTKKDQKPVKTLDDLEKEVITMAKAVTLYQSAPLSDLVIACRRLALAEDRSEQKK